MTAASAPSEVNDERSMKRLLTHALLPESRLASGILATGIESPDGRRKADGIWASYQRGAGLEGYEVKVSRSDLLAELADPMKAESWLQYCTRWWLFVADPKLIDGLDIPDRWGVIAPPSGRRTRSLTIIRPAPKLHPIDTSLAWQRVVTWYAVRHADRSAHYERRLSDKENEIGRLREQVNEAQHGSSPQSQHMGALYSRVIQALRERGITSYHHNINPDDDPVGDAIVVAAADLLLAERYVGERLRVTQLLLDDLETALAGLRPGWHPDALRSRIDELMAKNPPAPSRATA